MAGGRVAWRVVVGCVVVGCVVVVVVVMADEAGCTRDKVESLMVRES